MRGRFGGVLVALWIWVFPLVAPWVLLVAVNMTSPTVPLVCTRLPYIDPPPPPPPPAATRRHPRARRETRRSPRGTRPAMRPRTVTPSTTHESVLLWLRDDPTRLSALLALTGHPPCATELAVEDSALRVAFPVEVKPDLVLREPSSPTVRRWVLVEVQRRPDEAKARRWPLAMAAMANRYGPHGELVVITASREVERWAAGVARHRAGGTDWGVTPTVLRIGGAEAATILAQGPPEMALCAAWAVQGRRGSGALAIARAALTRAADIADAALRRSIEEGILAVLHPTVVEKVKGRPVIDISQLPKNPAVEQWKKELRVEGRLEGAAAIFLRVLRQRGFAVGADVEARVLAVTDPARIERWIDRALVAATLDDVFSRRRLAPLP